MNHNTPGIFARLGAHLDGAPSRLTATRPAQWVRAPATWVAQRWEGLVLGILAWTAGRLGLNLLPQDFFDATMDALNTSRAQRTARKAEAVDDVDAAYWSGRSDGVGEAMAILVGLLQGDDSVLPAQVIEEAVDEAV